ncbi:hypothetical protein GCM10011402_34680 [Paracoccus acridae]|uniref:Uncharacterized protein n=1 Tax=Paracoccus acridae TaxID=1795310 RepID=A0ABQ1VNC5_9RHOB|nr:hypothetical protein [Paracoccus acridae]GGF79101.1 hypothetical protein GCM10011402_34680 [Paracoccus acridae]
MDLTTDNHGKVLVRAGKYLSKNPYADVEVRGNGTGLFYERDYQSEAGRLTDTLSFRWQQHLM